MIIEDITVVDHGADMSWYAKTVNRGKQIARNQLEIRGYQMLGTRALGSAGETMLSGTALPRGERRTFARQNWIKLRDAGQLKVVIKDKRTGKSTSKIVSLPSPGNQAVSPGNDATNQISSMESEQFTSPEQRIIVTDSSYKGRGKFTIGLKNIGNRGIMPDQLTLRPIYHVSGRPLVIGKTISNRSAINAGSTKMVSGGGGGIYVDGMSECSWLKQVVIEIKNPTTGQLLEHRINIPERPKGEITQIQLHNSNLYYHVKNTGLYETKFNVRMLNLGVNKGKNNLFKIVKDLLYATVTLKPGETGLVNIRPEQVNRELKAQIPGLKHNKFYGVNIVHPELYMANDSDYCSKKSTPFVIEQPQHYISNQSADGEEILYRK